MNSWQLENVALFSQGVMYAESSQTERIARQVVCGEKVSSAARRLLETYPPLSQSIGEGLSQVNLNIQW